MRDTLHLYEMFGQLFAYPVCDYLEIADRCRRALGGVDDASAESLGRFIEGLRDLCFEKIEEMFTHTFDMGPASTLEIGWHLYGENYDRGMFLVWMRQQLRKASIEETHELPDHMSHVLPILGRMEHADANEFSSICVLPSMNKVHEVLKDHDNPFEHLAAALCAYLTNRHGPAIESDGGVSLPILQQHEELLAREGI